MARKKKHDEHANHEAWAIPYGDLVTLLLAFFVVMYAISSINEGKYRVLSDSLQAAFRGTPRTIEPVQIGEKQSGMPVDSAVAVLPLTPSPAMPRGATNPIPGSLQRAGLPMPGAGTDAESKGTAGEGGATLDQIKLDVERDLKGLIDEGALIVRRNANWLEVEIRADILFASGSSMLGPEAASIIDRVGDVLQPYPNSVRVEGHTDNVPIQTGTFPSNWELSAARAAIVVRRLAARGVDAGRLVIIGYGEWKPIAANDTPEGRNSNRRVLLVILSSDIPPKRRGTPTPVTPVTAAIPAAQGAP